MRYQIQNLKINRFEYNTTSNYQFTLKNQILSITQQIIQSLTQHLFVISLSHKSPLTNKLQQIQYSKQMIQLYAILHNFQDVLQLQIPNKSNRQTLCSLYKHIEKKIKSQSQISKLIKSTKIQDYFIYYFRQDQFVFIIVTIDGTKIDRIQNYLRVIAEIFYQNYDEKKFHIILERIIKQINRIESPNQDKPLSFQEEETFLTTSPLPQYKDKINSLMEKKSKQSKRVYVIMSVLFIAIFVLLMVFICKSIDKIIQKTKLPQLPAIDYPLNLQQKVNQKQNGIRR